jgi:putative ABC transport system substrate-binding protein
MKRRAFIAGLASAVGWPFDARAQRPMPVVGFLHYASATTLTHLTEAVRRGLRETSHIEGQNVTIEYRYADGHYERLRGLCDDLVRRQVNVIAAGGNVAAQAARAATKTIPVVFTSGADPIKSGLIRSLSRPEGNLTGVSLLAAEMATKRLELLRDLLPNARAVAMITNPTYPGSDDEMAEVEAAARKMGMRAHKLTASTAGEVDTAFAAISQLRVDAFLVGADGFFITRREQLAELATRHALPGVYPFPDFPAAGGLLSYGLSLSDAYRQVGVYAGRILKGARPADLPVMQPSKFELILNLKAAKSFGLNIPSSFQLRADEIIE